MNLSQHGFVRVAAVAPNVVLANPRQNAQRILEKYELLIESGCSVVLTPELSITGYSCEDLFHTQDLMTQTQEALIDLCEAITGTSLLVVGAPLRLEDGRLLNTALVLSKDGILGAVPKVANPNYGEFYEQRWFASGLDVDSELTIGSYTFRVSTKQLFRIGEFLCAIEICEDLWMPQPMSAQHAINGATLILNPSASTEQVAKSEYRRDLVRMQSGSCIAGYVYAGAAYTESTKDVVYSGHLMIAENATILGESDRFTLDAMLMGDIDCEKLTHERSTNATFNSISRESDYQIVGQKHSQEPYQLSRTYTQKPFVPKDQLTLDHRASEILQIQSKGLERRVRAAKAQALVIGLSGGLDSTWALLVCLETVQQLAWNSQQILAVTLPGPGTSQQTLTTVKRLAAVLGLRLIEIDISETVTRLLKDMNHTSTDDVTFENTQARLRTQLLFNLANKHQGIVVGTGDLSELALGWCTFNADHMANYNVNTGVPKTLVSHLVEWYASNPANAELSEVLKEVLDTPITPELLPIKDNRIEQKTEEIIGPYELHDFSLYHFLRTGAGVRKILVLANIAFSGRYQLSEIKKWLMLFFERFHKQQFKRTTLPPGPKVGTVSLSPRGDWRMPDETTWEASMLGQEN